MNRIRRFQREDQEPPAKKRVRRFSLTPLTGVLLAGVPVALLALYLTKIAPELIPVPAEVNVPFPAATRFLEQVCLWCSAHPWHVLLIGLGLPALGLIPAAGRRYRVALAVVATLALTFTYLSISAPIDRLLNTVEATLSQTERSVPDFLPDGTTRE